MERELYSEPIFLNGTVIHGRGIGKLVGTPTANLGELQIKEIPPQGVYVTQIVLHAHSYYGVTHIGRRPTVDNDSDISIEIHILNFNQDVYGERMEIQLYQKLREPRKFDDLAALLEQIRMDCDAVRVFFGLNDLSQQFSMDIHKHMVKLKGGEVFLSNKEFDALYLLYSNPEVAYTKEQIYEAVWHQPSNGCFHAVENTIFQIRKKLRSHENGDDCIKTIVGYGYKFNQKTDIND
ncbi:hypothetical protein J2Z76_000178 [Sedimentibacter acidaminivorans]|uniref:riboflavin kinase n=1 Tax=Sedimentibacter acidaminivorans TaxID=913099 RepID=A0ABS4G9F8_9FIRM|nr:riboflavin kinase [Sedimentibacter acidaminivorans]MBP1924325.1 hypothetical protein [Sedimentibacter acidaminivorans]